MKKLDILFIAILLAVFTFAVADNMTFSPTGHVVSDFSNANAVISNIDSAKEQYNNNLDQVPGFVKSMFGNERINLTMTMADGSIKHFSIVTRKGYVENISVDYFNDYTMDVSISEKTANDIISSKNQIGRLRQALNDKEIEYHSHRFKTSIKTGTSRFFISISRIFR